MDVHVLRSLKGMELLGMRILSLLIHSWCNLPKPKVASHRSLPALYTHLVVAFVDGCH